MRLGLLFLRSGTTNFRVAEAMNALAAKLGILTLDTQVTLNGIAATATRAGATVTLVRENTVVGLDAHRLASLERLVTGVEEGETPGEVNTRLSQIESMPPLHAVPATAVAVGFACGGFALLNGGSFLACCMVTMSASAGQALRTILLHRRLNQFVVTAVCGAFASTLYWLIAKAPRWTASLELDDAAGFVSAVLFLTPGFPLVTALLDLIRLHFTSGMTRIAYGLMSLLAGFAGLGLVAGAAGLVPTASTTTVVAQSSVTMLHASASFLGGLGFAILYNSTWSMALIVGGLAVIGNLVRLGLHDAGLAPAPATFVGALVVGLLATRIRSRLRTPRIALTVPGTIIMIPGLAAYDTLTLLNRGEVVEALRMGGQAGFTLGAIAMGLAAARILTDSAWALDGPRT